MDNRTVDEVDAGSDFSDLANEPVAQENFDGYERSSRFWYKEGTVIIQADDKLFRVHRELLQTHSGFFRDLFSMPQPPEGRVFEGCDVITAADAQKDWERMLEYMYHPATLHPDHPDITAEELVSLVRIGRKYICDSLLGACLRRLKTELPSTLEDFDKLHADSVLQEDGHLGGTKMTSSVESLFTLMDAAIEFDIQTIMPCAFTLAMLRLDEKFIKTGIEHGGVGDTPAPALNEAAKRAILHGGASLYPIMLGEYSRWISPEPIAFEPHCAQIVDAMCTDHYHDPKWQLEWPNCHKGFEEMGPRLLEIITYHFQGRELALMPWSDGALFGRKMTTGMCEHCHDGELELQVDARKAIWNKLPTMFGLEKEWNQLTDGIA